MYLLLNVKPRHREADRMSLAILEGKYTPLVDVFIPTYNEPISILKRTVIGCQALDYFYKKIYILDDGKRSEVKQLAQDLGCGYITRPNNHHAKAGNLNHALTKTCGELIVVFDADFVPTTNFLTRTLGFFQNPKLALLQTYQSFYNPDPVARNLGLEDKITPEVEIFSRQYQLLRDGIGTAMCYGSSFVVSRNLLEKVGGFVTESLSEDYFTGVRLASQGYQVIYLRENLSAGLSAENMAAYIRQKLRWSRGTMQAFFIKENPLTIPGLNLLQRLAHLEGIIQWFTSIFRAIFLVLPLLYPFLAVSPVQATVQDSIYYFIPFYLIQLVTFSWLNYRSRSALLSDIYSVATCFPVAVNVIQTLMSPFSVKFNVTPKGLCNEQLKFNWKLAFPLIIVFILNLLNLGYSICHYFQLDLATNLNENILTGMWLTWVWSGYNLIILSNALLVMFDAPKSDLYEWFNFQTPVRVLNGDTTIQGITTKLSERGAEIELNRNFQPMTFLKIEIIETGLILQGKVMATKYKGNGQNIRVEFEKISLEEYKSLVELLFCRPGRWKLRQTPSELHSLWLLCRVLLKPRFLTQSSHKV